ncbi:DUF438 domain-containing protein [Spirochaetota bacterium]
MDMNKIRPEQRAEVFNKLLRSLIDGGNAKAAKEAKAFTEDAKPRDLADAVDALLAEGYSEAKIKKAVSRLINLMYNELKKHEAKPPRGERFIASLMAENAALLKLLEDGKAVNMALNSGTGRTDGKRAALLDLQKVLTKLNDIEQHYIKKENILFPWFERRYPKYRCVRLMWDIENDVRRGLKEAGALCSSMLENGAKKDLAPLNMLLGMLYFDLNTVAFRENCALFPISLELMEPEEAEELFEEASAIGYAFLDKKAVDRLEGPEANILAAARIRLPKKKQVMDNNSAQEGGQSHAKAASEDSSPLVMQAHAGFTGRTGRLDPEVLAAMFERLPVDLSYVDAEDKVQWFSDSQHRIFARSPAIIGRDVRNCHPAGSVDRVMAIIDAFKSGKKDREEFWIQQNDRFIHIEYFALYSKDGTYLGVLESSQDITELRALKGQKRL